MPNSPRRHALTPNTISPSQNNQTLICSRMILLWVFGILLHLPTTLPSEVIEPGPPTGIVLQESPGLLITHCRLYTQRIYVRLDPWDVYRKHIRLPPQLTEGRLSGIQTHDTIEHAKQATVHVLEQLDKFMVTEKDLSTNKRPKRFLGALLAAAAGVGSLFSIGLSAANSVSLGALQRHMGELEEEMPEFNRDSSFNENSCRTWVKLFKEL